MSVWRPHRSLLSRPVISTSCRFVTTIQWRRYSRQTFVKSIRRWSSSSRSDNSASESASGWTLSQKREMLSKINPSNLSRISGSSIRSRSRLYRVKICRKLCLYEEQTTPWESGSKRKGFLEIVDDFNFFLPLFAIFV